MYEEVEGPRKKFHVPMAVFSISDHSNEFFSWRNICMILVFGRVKPVNIYLYDNSYSLIVNNYNQINGPAIWKSF